MRTCFITILLFGCVAVLTLGTGCRRAAAPPPAPSVTVAVQKPETPPAEIPPSEPLEPDKPAAESPAPLEPEPALEAETAPSLSPRPFNPSAVERFVLFTPQIPLIVEVELLIDGQPHTETFAALIEEVLKVGDTDGDGRTLWKEVTESKRFRYGQYGNLPFDRQNGARQITEQYDLDRDGVLDREEAPRFLTRNAGGSRPFSLRGTTDWRDLNLRDAATWEIVDTDRDGILSAHELAELPARLRSRDQDDDDLLYAVDFRPTTPGGMDAPRRRLRGPDANRLLGPYAAWDRIQMDMEKIYALGGRLKRDDLPLVPNLMALLDADNNGGISAKEYPRLNDAPAHVRISLAFGAVSTAADPKPSSDATSQEQDDPESDALSVSEKEFTEASRPVLSLVEVSPAAQALGIVALSQEGRLFLEVPGMRVSFAVNDTIGTADFEAQARQSLTMFDGDKNGYLEASEVPEGAQTLFGRFEAVDLDEDGKVYAGEIVRYLSHQQAALRSQIHAKAEDVQDAFFPLLDEDRDGRLLGREIESAGKRLLAFDKNGDGQIDSDELPGEMLVVFARGSLENRDQLFTLPVVTVSRSTADLPRWFARMDENGDGYISPREFLGERDKFQMFDRDQDGFLSPQEIP